MARSAVWGLEPPTLTFVVKRASTEPSPLSSYFADKEPPKVFDCDTDNQHININGKQDVVTWKEPRFTDNSGLYAKPVPSIQNGIQRAAQIYYVSYTAQDIAGNRASCNFFVHVHG